MGEEVNLEMQETANERNTRSEHFLCLIKQGVQLPRFILKVTSNLPSISHQIFQT